GEPFLCWNLQTALCTLSPEKITDCAHFCAQVFKNYLPFFHLNANSGKDDDVCREQACEPHLSLQTMVSASVFSIIFVCSLPTRRGRRFGNPLREHSPSYPRQAQLQRTQV